MEETFEVVDERGKMVLLDAAIVEDKRIDGIDLVLYVILNTEAYFSSDEPPTYKRFAKRIGCHEDDVKAALNILDKFEYIKITEKDEKEFSCTVL